MNIKEYISSGILELYVLNMLSEEESREVTRLLKKHPELQTEVDKIQQSLKAYAENQSPAPSSGLENSILESVSKVPQEDGPFSGSTTPKQPGGDSKTGFRGISLLLGAVAIAAIAFGIWTYSQQQNTQTQLEQQQLAFQTLQDSCSEKDRTIDQLSDRVDILLNPDNRKIQLGSPDGTSQALATVFYNTNDQKAYLNIGNLNTPPQDRFYQLWALVDGVPVDMGEFEITTVGDTSIIEVPFIADAGAFAITLEPRDGDPAPNLAELQVIGNVS